jgi:hypothetical protein
MLNHNEFWSRIESVGCGQVWLCVWRSWKQVADEDGFDGLDLAAGLFRGVFERATASSSFRGAVSLNAFAAFWPVTAPLGEADATIEIASDKRIVCRWGRKS